MSEAICCSVSESKSRSVLKRNTNFEPTKVIVRAPAVGSSARFITPFFEPTKVIVRAPAAGSSARFITPLLGLSCVRLP